jgi:hypothetical protein
MSNVEHKFYLKTEKEQQRIQLKIAGGAILFNLILLLFLFAIGLPLLSFLSISITLSIIAPFFDTPSLAKQGEIIYYSPLFLTEKEKNGVITIHGGTLFDYYYVIDRSLNGTQRTNLIIKGYLDGLLGLIEEYEDKAPDLIKIRGTSYIINERTANKIGLKKVKTNFLQSLILSFNYFNLMSSYSLAKAKLSFPNLRNIHTFEGSLEELMKQKTYLLRLRKLL